MTEKMSFLRDSTQRALPRRIVIRFSVQYEREEFTIIETFFESYSLKDFQDYHSHLCAPNESSTMQIVLDFNCKAIPVVDDLHAIDHLVFKAFKKENKLYVSYPFERIA